MVLFKKGNDYVDDYFDNGENYGDDDGGGDDDEPVYWSLFKQLANLDLKIFCLYIAN